MIEYSWKFRSHSTGRCIESSSKCNRCTRSPGSFWQRRQLIFTMCMTALLQVQTYGQLPECRWSINTQASQLAGAGGVACGYHVIDHGYAGTHSVVLVLQGFGGMCWIVLVVAVSIPAIVIVCHCGCTCASCCLCLCLAFVAVVVAVVSLSCDTCRLFSSCHCRCFHIWDCTIKLLNAPVQDGTGPASGTCTGMSASGRWGSLAVHSTTSQACSKPITLAKPKHFAWQAW